MIRFNIPYITGKEISYIQDVISRGHLSGDGHYSALCSGFFRNRFSFQNNYLTTSGTDALEMASILADIRPGDEVILPSYTFVSTANAFVLRGAKTVFADSLPDHPNVDPLKIEESITARTKALLVMHYGGVACDMDAIMLLAQKNNLTVIEDAAHSIDSSYKGKPLGSIGDFGAFSFHETKNIVCGEGGLLVVRDDKLSKRAEIVREKGTNRTSFFRGEVNKYGWVDIGSSFLASEILAAFLYAQLESLDEIQKLRLAIWERYHSGLSRAGNYGYALPRIPDFATNNAHLFYLLAPSLEKRTGLIDHLNKHNIRAVFHYLPLHNSNYYKSIYPARQELPNSVRFADTLVRLPLYPSLSAKDQDFIIERILEYVSR